MTTVADVARFLELWAPPATAQSYDNVGLLIGDPEDRVETVIVALDLTPDVVHEAVDAGADLIVTHHPLIFRPLKRITAGPLVSGLALQLARSGIALYSAHTNLDAALDGVSFELAKTLGLKNVSVLQRLDDSLYKLVTFVPESHADEVRAALASAGAGHIGDYDSCAFEASGTGYFRPREGAQPFVGKTGAGVQSADELRVEVEVVRWRIDATVEALMESHPYEEVAYDVYPVAQRFQHAGLGAVGDLSAPMSRDDFLAHVADRLEADGVRHSGPSDITISRVAVCGGSGSDLLGEARRSGAQAFVTADVSYHRFFDVFDDTGRADLLLIDAGHYETEAPTESLLADRLSEHFPEVSVARTRARTSPIEYFSRV